MRFHPHTPFGRGRAAQFRPAIIAAVVEANRFVGIQRLFLERDGSRLASDVEKPKWGLARLSATEQPLPIASTYYGWFIPTSPLDGEAGKQLPAELLPILEFARAQGCDHALFDSDGPTVPDLTEFPW